MNNSVTTPDISAATLAVTNLSGALHGLHTYLGQGAAQNAGSTPLESRLLNLDSTLQQMEPLAFWQYLTLRVVYYVLHICAPQAGYMPQYSSVAVIFVDQSLFFY